MRTRRAPAEFRSSATRASASLLRHSLPASRARSTHITNAITRHGYHPTTVAQIAAELNMGLGTFYRYFKSKLAVFEAVIEEVMAEVTVVLASESPTASKTVVEYRAQVERIGRALYAAFQKNRTLARLLFVEAPGISHELNEKLLSAVKFFGVATQAYLDNGVSRGFLKKSLDTEVTALLINSMIFEGVRHVATPESTEVLERWITASTAPPFRGDFASALT